MPNSHYHILIAEDNDVSRQMMVGVLKAQGFNVSEAVDGTAAIEQVLQHDFDLALVDINMAPKGGFEFVQHLIAEDIKLPVVIVTGDESTDMLLQAQNLGVKHILQKPVLPDRLIYTMQKVFAKDGNNPAHMKSLKDARFDHKGLMLRAIELAVGNAISGKGLAFGALVADKDGHIVAEGVSGAKDKVDPLAHAEIVAIRKAVEQMGHTDLSQYRLYTSCEPTLISKALILGVGIAEVFYGLGIDDIQGLAEAQEEIKNELMGSKSSRVSYEQICYDETIRAFSAGSAAKAEE